MAELEIAPSMWLETFERDYLATFIRDGGAAIKVLVMEPSAAAPVLGALRDGAERTGLICAHVDEAVQRVHYMDRLFNEIARQVDWQRLAADFMRRQFSVHGYTVPDGQPLIDDVAAINSIDVSQVQMTVEQEITSAVIRDYAMARDFRVAMAQLCRSAVQRDDLLADTAQRVEEWLKGDLRFVRALRTAMIFEKINRYSARAMLASLGHWVRRAGHSGLLVTIDIARFASARPTVTSDGTEMRPATPAAVMDTYELMRQCIDGTDEMEGIAICFLSGPEFVQDDKRGMRAYPALEQRLTDDVRDRRRSNPHAPMVRLGA